MQKIKNFIITQSGKAKKKKFFSAIEEGKFPIVKEMLEQGQVDPHIIDAEGNTPLHMAAFHMQGEMIKLLMERRASMRARNHKRQTPLHLAATRSSAIIDLLCLYKIERDAQDELGNTALHYAVIDHWNNFAHALIAQGVCLNIQNNEGNTPLHLVFAVLAAEVFEDPIAQTTEQHVLKAMATYLLKAGALISIRNKKNELPAPATHLVMRESIYEPFLKAITLAQNNNLVLRLLKQGADPNVECPGDEIPLRRITHSTYNQDLVCMLLDYGADPLQLPAWKKEHHEGKLIQYRDGNPTITLALRNNQPEMATLLITHVPRIRCRQAWNAVAVSMACCKIFATYLPRDVYNLITKIATRNAIIDAQHTCAIKIGEGVMIYLNGDMASPHYDTFNPEKCLQYLPIWHAQIHERLKNRRITYNSLKKQ